MPRLNRRDVLATGSALAAATVARGAQAQSRSADDAIAIPDDGWRLWLDDKAPWENDAIHLPGTLDLATLPANPPTGGWDALGTDAGIAVTLPSTVEQHFWGTHGTRAYTPDEYRWADTDSVPQNGAYRGVSWWWREIDIPADFRGKQILLAIRGARLRAEVYLNRVLVGYSILEELPFECDLTAAASPGGRNVLAIRITNAGGRYDWVDGDTLEWGTVKIPRTHGFGGLDRGLSLSAHPMAGRIADLWVLNTPDPKTVHAFVHLEPPTADTRNLHLAIAEEQSGRTVAAHIVPLGKTASGALEFAVTAKSAKLWSLEHPNLYRLTARWTAPGGESRCSRTFGFRWFAPDGLGRDAVLRLNGKRIKLYSAISWGYWALNGVWPTPDLAVKEVTQAKALGLNCLSFHRNPGKEDVLAAQDRLGLLRSMEPGGGKLALGRWPDKTKVDAHSIVMAPALTDADKFAQAYELAKCVAMIRAFRSHPSLIRYTLQNEVGADLSDPNTKAVLDAMRAEDESRVILLNDGFVASPTSAAQAWYAPYDPGLHRSDKEPFGGWWDDHQGAGDQWYDAFYANPNAFNYRQPLKTAIVEFGEMEGCAVPDNHVLAIAETMREGGKAYDLADRQEIVAAYQAFLDKWGFRGAFPNVEDLFRAIGRKSYASWQQYMENARINDATDVAVISGWESTAIDNHSGIVDNFRNFKSDPAPIATALLSVRPIAKQRNLCVGRGESAVFDHYLCNDTGVAVQSALQFSMTDPQGKARELVSFPAPIPVRDRFSAMVGEGYISPPLVAEGAHRFSLSLAGDPRATQVRDIWVVDTKKPPIADRTLKLGLTGVWPRLRDQLAQLTGITLEEAVAGRTYDAILASGLTDASTPAQKLGGDEGIDLQKSSGSTPVPGALPEWVIAAAKAGTPLLLLPQEDALADGVARQLAGEGAFRYDGQVGRLRAPWMGNWYFLREHPVYAGMPQNCEMGLYFQAHGRQANGLLVDGPDVDVFVGYGRDHDRRVGAGTFSFKLGKGKVLFQRVPDLAGPMQLRFLINAIGWLYQ